MSIENIWQKLNRALTEAKSILPEEIAAAFPQEINEGNAEEIACMLRIVSDELLTHAITQPFDRRFYMVAGMLGILSQAIMFKLTNADTGWQESGVNIVHVRAESIKNMN